MYGNGVKLVAALWVGLPCASPSSFVFGPVIVFLDNKSCLEMSRDTFFSNLALSCISELSCFGPVLSLVLPCLVLPCLALPCLALSCLVLSCLVLSRLVSSRLVSSRLVSSRLVSSRLVSSRLVSSRLVSSRLVSSRLVSSRLVSSRLVLENNKNLVLISVSGPYVMSYLVLILDYCVLTTSLIWPTQFTGSHGFLAHSSFMAHPVLCLAHPVFLSPPNYFLVQLIYCIDSLSFVGYNCFHPWLYGYFKIRNGTFIKI